MATAITINGVSFNGSANITISDSTKVALTGNETIAGIKTFSSSPIVPTPTTDTQAVNKQYVDGIYSGFKNYIINGKKVVNQRGLTATDNSYNQDRWYKAGNNWFQGIEGDNNLISGKTYTLSWVGVATASYYVGNTTSATVNAQTFTPIVNGGSFTLTIGAGQNLWIKFVSDATGSTFNFVQLEVGSVATPFEQRPIGLELSLCQRYLRNIDGAVGMIDTTPSNAVLSLNFGTPMRVSPTTVFYSCSVHEMSIANRMVTGIVSTSFSTYGGYIRVTMSSSGTAQNVANLSGTLLVAAEL